MKKINNYLMIFAVVFLAACESEPDTTLQNSLVGNTVDETSISDTLAINATSQAVGNGTTLHLYDPANGILPSATDIIFKDSLDGTLNIPIVSGDPQTAVKNGNECDGWFFHRYADLYWFFRCD